MDTATKPKRDPALHRTQIEWVLNADGSQGLSWNPVVGCSHCSPGCDNCYAAKLAATRLKHRPEYEGLAGPIIVGGVRQPGRYAWTGDTNYLGSRLLQPLRRRKPAMIFVCDMGDLFHHGVRDAFIDKVWAVMGLCVQHFFVVLTKRPARMAEYVSGLPQNEHYKEQLWHYGLALKTTEHSDDGSLTHEQIDIYDNFNPLPNVGLMATCCTQAEFDEKVPQLMRCPAAWRGVSLEPLLEIIDLTRWLHCTYSGEQSYQPVAYSPTAPQLDWVIVGGETGPNARLMAPSWARDIREQCRAASAPYFFKHWGTYNNDPPLSVLPRLMPQAWRTWAKEAGK